MLLVTNYSPFNWSRSLSGTLLTVSLPATFMADMPTYECLNLSAWEARIRTKGHYSWGLSQGRPRARARIWQGKRCLGSELDPSL